MRETIMSQLEKQSTSLTKSKFERELAKREFGEGAILVLDISSSMSAADANGERRIDALRSVVYGIRSRGIPFRQLVFNNDVMWSDVIPEPAGGTNMALAFDTCKQANTRHVIVVSDGEPQDMQATLAAAQRLACPVDAYYVGPAGNEAAQEFMKQLAARTGAKVGEVSFKELETKIAGVLSAGTLDGEEKKESIA